MHCKNEFLAFAKIKPLQGRWMEFLKKNSIERHSLISGSYSSFYGRMPLKLGAAWLWICIQMNTEQIIQSTDPGLRLLRLHPSCYVFTIARSQNLIPSHHVQSCEPNQSDVLLKGTVGSCSVWEKQKRFLCDVKHAKICSLLIAVIKVFNRPWSIFSVVRNRNFLYSYRLVLCPVLSLGHCVLLLIPSISYIRPNWLWEWNLRVFLFSKRVKFTD